MRLIDADALKKAFESWKNMDDYYHDTNCDNIPLSEAYDLINNAPTVVDTTLRQVFVDGKKVYPPEESNEQTTN